MDFQRPPGFKFACKGMNLRSPADAIPSDKYAVLVNSRAVSDTALQTRPGYATLFDTADNHAVTDIGSYATLGTDALPRFLARLSNDKVYLDNAALVTTLATGGAGACMLPFRPSASAQSWMYITNGGDYQKLSAPDAGNVVVAQKVGIAEPGSQIDAATNAPVFTTFNALAASWTPGGTAGATSDTSLFSDTVGATVKSDPVVATRKSAQVVIEYYAPGMLVTFAGVNTYPVEEVWKPCATTTISAIRYYSGVTGMCMVVPAIDLSGTLGRGALVTLGSGGGAETVLVLSVIKGVNGTCALPRRRHRPDEKAASMVPEQRWRWLEGQLLVQAVLRPQRTRFGLRPLLQNGKVPLRPRLSDDAMRI